MYSTFEWACLIALLCVTLIIDYLVVDRRPHAFSTKEAGTWAAIYASAAFVFAGYVWATKGEADAGAFVSGYLTEYLLSVDNLFVFLVLLTSFSVPRELVHHVLMIGVVLALVLRGALIGVGAAVIHAYEPVLLVFAAALVWTAIGVWRSSDADPDPEGNRFVRWVSSRLPFDNRYHGRAYRVSTGHGRKFTPLLLVILAIGTTDLLFALDSIPAVFGLTTNSFLVFAVNAFALMGLRQLFFLLRTALGKLEHLTKGLSVILVFISVKLILETMPSLGVTAPTIDAFTSLVVIAAVLSATVLAGFAGKRRSRGEQAKPGEALEDLLGGADE